MKGLVRGESAAGCESTEDGGTVGGKVCAGGARGVKGLLKNGAACDENGGRIRAEGEGEAGVGGRVGMDACGG